MVRKKKGSQAAPCSFQVAVRGDLAGAQTGWPWRASSQAGASCSRPVAQEAVDCGIADRGAHRLGWRKATGRHAAGQTATPVGTPLNSTRPEIVAIAPRTSARLSSAVLLGAPERHGQAAADGLQDFEYLLHRLGAHDQAGRAEHFSRSSAWR